MATKKHQNGDAEDNQAAATAQPVAKPGDANPKLGHSDAPATPLTAKQIEEANAGPTEQTTQSATPNQPALGEATTAASALVPNAPAAPTDLEAPQSPDPRLGMAHDFASRGLSYASVNDLAKAVLLMLDLHANPGKSDILDAIEAGEVPTLL